MTDTPVLDADIKPPVVQVDKKAQSRHWCFTINQTKGDAWKLTSENWNDMQVHFAHLYEIKQIRFIATNVEQAEDTGRPHIQGYVEFMRPKRLSEAKSTLGYTHAHLAPRWGTRTQALDYVCKEQDLDFPEFQGPNVAYRVSVGVWRPDHEALKGQRTLADRCIDLVLRGYNPHQVAKEAPAAYFAHSRKVWDLYRALGGEFRDS